MNYLLPLACAFLLGVGVGTYEMSRTLMLFAGVVGIALLAVWYVRRVRIVLIASVCVLVCLLGLVRVSLTPQILPATFHTHLNQEASFLGTVVEPPDVRDTFQFLVVRVQEGEDTTRVLVRAPLDVDVRTYDRVRVTGVYELPTDFSTREERVFHYQEHLAARHIFSTLSFAQVEVVNQRQGLLSFVGALRDSKQEGIDALSRTLPEPQASLASGILLGGKQGLGEELVDVFILTGLIHIVVLSGYNVLIVAQTLLWIGKSTVPRLAVPLSIASIAVFVFIAGAGAASVRAGLMAMIALFARASGRTGDALRILALATITMVLVNPLILMYDVGFQLSILATLGLILGTPRFEKMFARIRVGALREIVSATCAAQVAVAPLLLYQSGIASLVSLPANVLVLPLVPLAMGLSLLALVGQTLLPPLGSVLALPAYFILSVIESIARLLADIPYAHILLPAFSSWALLPAYATLLYILWRTPIHAQNDSPPRSSSRL